MVKVIFFGRLKDVLKCDSVDVEQFELGTVSELRAQLQQRGERWADFLAADKALVAVNQNMVDEDAAVNATDEVAFFPPVTGG